MHLGSPVNKRTKTIVTGIAAAFLLLFLIAFWKEVAGSLQVFWALLKAALGFPLVVENKEAARAVQITFFNCLIGFGAVFATWLVLISAQALLPVSNLKEMYRTAYHLLLYITKQHGPAIFIKDGEKVMTTEDLVREGPGVMVVDFNSAVVLEERGAQAGLARPVSKLSLGWLYLLGLGDAYESPRVCGPGITYMRPRMRIRGVVDLRKHFMLQPRVSCYTREGIELYANVWAIFTIGQDPDILQVAYVGAPRAENLRVITTAPIPGGRVRITGISNELDEADREEIHHFARVAGRLGVMRDFFALPDTTRQNFNKHRVFSAVFAQARNSNQEELAWADLPTRVAADFYREILSQTNYDDLYDIRGNGRFPIPGFKNKLRLKMRNNGILAYRLISTESGEPFIINTRAYLPADLLVSDVRPLTNTKILRDRGIKILASGFGDLIPVSPAIYKQRLDNWRASWEKDYDLLMANRELDAMRIRARARTETQQDLWYSLSQLFERNEHSDEALALRVLQALEQAAADPTTRQLLPSNTMDVMGYVHRLLTPGEEMPGRGKGSRGPELAVNAPEGKNGNE